jgi:hypothetical protein
MPAISFFFINIESEFQCLLCRISPRSITTEASFAGWGKDSTIQ